MRAIEHIRFYLEERPISILVFNFEEIVSLHYVNFDVNLQNSKGWHNMTGIWRIKYKKS